MDNKKDDPPKYKYGNELLKIIQIIVNHPENSKKLFQIIYSSEEGKHFFEFDGKLLCNDKGVRYSIEYLQSLEQGLSFWQMMLPDFTEDVIRPVHLKLPESYKAAGKELLEFGKEKIYEEYQHYLWNAVISIQDYSVKEKANE